eukprot:gene4461-31104_t
MTQDQFVAAARALVDHPECLRPTPQALLELNAPQLLAATWRQGEDKEKAMAFSREQGVGS